MIEVRIQGGKHYVFYKNVLLPMQIKTNVFQDVEMANTGTVKLTLTTFAKLK